MAGPKIKVLRKDYCKADQFSDRKLGTVTTWHIRGVSVSPLRRMTIAPLEMLFGGSELSLRRCMMSCKQRHSSR